MWDKEAGVPLSITPLIDHGAMHAREGCVVEELTPQTFYAVKQALPDHGWGVSLSEDHQTITPMEPPAEWVAQRAAAAAEHTALVALVAAHPDALVKALAQRAGIL